EFRGIIEIKLGNDALYGGAGNDTLEGGAGNDVLDGTDAIAACYFEKDILGGGLGRDTFVLGSAAQAYYVGASDLDFATIKDFNSAVDVIQLHGSASDYQQQQQTGRLHLSYGDELIAIFENVTTIDLNSDNVNYV
ncbi:MAG: calcium-binding protein, partial [Cyanobacteria bacterium J06649_4]